MSLSFEPAVAEGCSGKKRTSGDGWSEIIGKTEENTEAAIWRSTGVRGGDNKGTEIEWRPSRGMSPCDPAREPTTCLALIASFPRSMASPDPPRHKQTPRAVVLSPLRSRFRPLISVPTIPLLPCLSILQWPIHSFIIVINTGLVAPTDISHPIFC